MDKKLYLQRLGLHSGEAMATAEGLRGKLHCLKEKMANFLLEGYASVDWEPATGGPSGLDIMWMVDMELRHV